MRRPLRPFTIAYATLGPTRFRFRPMPLRRESAQRQRLAELRQEQSKSEAIRALIQEATRRR